ncbi:hypothetical protein BJ508DRAFT_41893 [Ascobolus immersus RN42]|uniref:Uncharacterized protein n=1 Tax=Ascobolus immersus RN42 TaxID=1160509 RepID=A0A3N4IJ35_ASCIM|nr:hypothetical protein BJ508DRAFT_41893 [Ascobolus immersus RN42]
MDAYSIIPFAQLGLDSDSTKHQAAIAIRGSGKTDQFLLFAASRRPRPRYALQGWAFPVRKDRTEGSHARLGLHSREWSPDPSFIHRSSTTSASLAAYFPRCLQRHMLGYSPLLLPRSQWISTGRSQCYTISDYCHIRALRTVYRPRQAIQSMPSSSSLSTRPVV